MQQEQPCTTTTTSTTSSIILDAHIKNTTKFQVLRNMSEYFKNKLKDQYSESDYNVFSIIDQNDADRKHFTQKLVTLKKNYQQNGQKIPMDKKQLELPLEIQRAVAVMLGLAIGDALGSCTQFTEFQKDRVDLIKFDFRDVQTNKQLYHRNGATNIWTDDCSMALSLADSLLLNNLHHNPKHSRFMYHMWLYHGLNNGGRPYSIGLGGNISISTQEFIHAQEDFTKEGNRFNSGNGSLMRLGPIPVTYFRDQQLAMKIAGAESRTTHNGLEARECCKLMTLIIVRLINRKTQEWKSVIDQACSDFQTDVPSVKHLAMSQQQPNQLFQQQCQQFKSFPIFNKSPSDRNWNWKSPDFTYSPSRAESMPGYVGSYCMDALAMALHTVWHGTNFHSIVLKNANMGGDCDTVGDIAGQIAGAIYGIDGGMLHLYGQMEDTLSGRYQVFLKAYKLAMQKCIPLQPTPTQSQ